MVYARWTTEYLYFSHIWTSDSFRLDQNHGTLGGPRSIFTSHTSGPVTALDSIRIMVYARWTTESWCTLGGPQYLYFLYIWTSDGFRLDQNHGVRSVDHGISIFTSHTSGRSIFRLDPESWCTLGGPRSIFTSHTSGPVTALDSIRIMVYARWTTEYLYFSYIWTSDSFRLDQNHGVRAVDHGVSLLLIHLDQ
ncbi:hypothetical protein RRG08_002707 [Elysia crispata]|uniref:Uncharacterized protein n=1 Tax=Elysia crispata TaxID=231223 RepID=A0AAE1CM05_9GAST|nr:hypothetical protein RRG08_002707 [Elysia crispata]